MRPRSSLPTAVVMAGAMLALPHLVAAQSPGLEDGTTALVAFHEETRFQRDDGSGGSSRTRAALLERVVTQGLDGIELEYTLPPERARRGAPDAWMFPVRVRKLPGEPAVLLNEIEVAARLEERLDEHPALRELCGRHVLTWRAVHVECDPLSVLDVVATYDLHPGPLRDGMPHEEAGALRPAPLRLDAEGPSGRTYVARLVIDPRHLREAAARTAIAVAQMRGETLPSIEEASAALRDWNHEGHMTVTFETDPAGRVLRSTREAVVQTVEPDGQRETRTTVQTVERRPAH